MDEPKRGDGLDCTCAAHSSVECGCGADWTPREVYELRTEVAKLKEDKRMVSASQAVEFFKARMPIVSDGWLLNERLAYEQALKDVRQALFGEA